MLAWLSHAKDVLARPFSLILYFSLSSRQNFRCSKLQHQVILHCDWQRTRGAAIRLNQCYHLSISYDFAILGMERLIPKFSFHTICSVDLWQHWYIFCSLWHLIYQSISCQRRNRIRVASRGSSMYLKN